MCGIARSSERISPGLTNCYPYRRCPDRSRRPSSLIGTFRLIDLSDLPMRSLRIGEPTARCRTQPAGRIPPIERRHDRLCVLSGAGASAAPKSRGDILPLLRPACRVGRNGARRMQQGRAPGATVRDVLGRKAMICGVSLCPRRRPAERHHRRGRGMDSQARTGLSGGPHQHTLSEGDVRLRDFVRVA